MRRTLGILLPAVVLGALAAAPVASADCLNSETVVVADPDAFAASEGGIIRVAKNTGRRRTVSSNNHPAGAPLFVDPYNLAYDMYATTESNCNGLAVADRGVLGAAGGGDGRVITVDPDNGARTLVSGGGVGAGPDLTDPTGIVVEAGGDILVTDQNGPLGTGSVIRIDRATGDRTVLAQNGGGVTDFFDPTDLAKETTGDVLVADREAYNFGSGGVYRINKTTGALTVVSNDGAPAGAPIFMEPTGIWLGAGLTRVADSVSSAGTGADIDLNVATGNRTRISDNNRPGAMAAPLFVSPRDVARKNSTLATDPDYLTDSALNGGSGGVFSVDIATGVRTVLSQNGAPAGGPNFDEPWGIIVTPHLWVAVPIEGPIIINPGFHPWLFRSSSGGSMRISIGRVGKGGKLTPIGKSTSTVRKGTNRVDLFSIIKAKDRKPGTYRLTATLTPAEGGNAAEPYVTDFTLKRKR